MKITFPHLGNYHIPIKYLLKELTDSEILTPPKITKKTIELGNKYSPDLICLPFKYNLGNFIESLDLGADTIIHIGGGCKFGYYAEVQEQILKDLGYKFKFYPLVSEYTFDIKKVYNIFKDLNPNLKKRKFYHRSIYVLLMIFLTDKINKTARKNKAFDKNNNYTKIINKMNKDFTNNKSILKLIIKYIKYQIKIKKVKIKKPNKYLKIGIIGELYTNMDSNANYDLENKLYQMNAEITRYTDASTLLYFRKIREFITLNKIKKYVKYNMGADASHNVARLIKLKKKGYDGVIHIKPAFCTPEISAIEILEKVSEDIDMPIIFLTYDVQDSDTGINTRLEAFNDMLNMRKEKNND